MPVCFVIMTGMVRLFSLLGTTHVRGASLNTWIPKRLLPSSLRIGKEQREWL